ncbi:MAG: hypothetical protein V4584_05695 [Verrucomicrobiota bacterium]
MSDYFRFLLIQRFGFTCEIALRKRMSISCVPRAFPPHCDPNRFLDSFNLQPGSLKELPEKSVGQPGFEPSDMTAPEIALREALIQPGGVKVILRHNLRGWGRSGDARNSVFWGHQNFWLLFPTIARI